MIRRSCYLALMFAFEGDSLARLSASRQPGALTPDLNSEALTSSVLNQYLTVKERAMV
jgi:hypothetical protein